MIEEVPITALKQFKIGNAQDKDAATGCTVVLCGNGATGGVDVRGGAPGTRETDLLRPENLIEQVHAVLLSGGSAFGLDAAAGVMAYLDDRGIGFDTGAAKVPIVPGAVLFDLNCGSHKVRPDKQMGYDCCLAAENNDFKEGSEGAGTGATVGKFLGEASAMKGGIGSFGLKCGELLLGAVVAVNCLGDVTENGRIIAGAYQATPFRFLDTERLWADKFARPGGFGGTNTTIGAVLTNACFTKAQTNKLASMAHDGYARAIRPAHTMFDGDTVFALASGEIKADLNLAGLLAARAVEGAILRAVKTAVGLGGYKSWQDCHGAKQP